MEVGSAVKVVGRNSPGVAVVRGEYRGLSAGYHRVGVHSNANNPNFINVRSFSSNNYNVLAAAAAAAAAPAAAAPAPAPAPAEPNNKYLAEPNNKYLNRKRRSTRRGRKAHRRTRRSTRR